MGFEEASRLGLQVAVGAFDVAVCEGIAGGPVHAHGVRSSGHAAIDDLRGAGQNQNLVRWCISGAPTPGPALAILVGDISLLRDGINTAAWMKRGVQHIAGTDPVRLAGGLRHDVSFRRPMDGR